MAWCALTIFGAHSVVVLKIKWRITAQNFTKIYFLHQSPSLMGSLTVKKIGDEYLTLGHLQHHFIAAINFHKRTKKFGSEKKTQTLTLAGSCKDDSALFSRFPHARTYYNQ